MIDVHVRIPLPEKDTSRSVLSHVAKHLNSRQRPSKFLSIDWVCLSVGGEVTG
jgi:hypothetical protein